MSDIYLSALVVTTVSVACGMFLIHEAYKHPLH